MDRLMRVCLKHKQVFRELALKAGVEVDIESRPE
jgi:hypothetical protein